MAAGIERAAPGLGTHDLTPQESADLVFFSSVSENTLRFVERLERPAVRIPLRPAPRG